MSRFLLPLPPMALRGGPDRAIGGHVYPEPQRLVDAGQDLRDNPHSIDGNQAEPTQTETLQQALTISASALSSALSRHSAVSFVRTDAAVRVLFKRGEVSLVHVSDQ